MTYGARESNPKEAMGLTLLITGLVLWAAGWAYGGPAVQIILVILGIAGVLGGFWSLRSARGTA